MSICVSQLTKDVFTGKRANNYSQNRLYTNSHAWYLKIAYFLQKMGSIWSKVYDLPLMKNWEASVEVAGSKNFSEKLGSTRLRRTQISKTNSNKKIKRTHQVRAKERLQKRWKPKLESLKEGSNEGSLAQRRRYKVLGNKQRPRSFLGSSYRHGRLWEEDAALNGTWLEQVMEGKGQVKEVTKEGNNVLQK